MDDRKQLHPAFWLLQTGGWLTYAVIYLISAIPDRDFRQVFLDREVAIAVLFVYSLFLRHRYRAWFGSRLSAGLLAQRAIPLCCLGGAASASIAHLLQVLLLPATDGRYFCLFTCIIWGTLQLCSWSALYFGIKHHLALQEEREQTLRAKSLARTAQLQALRYQLNPHFLFNTLNSISTLVLDGDRKQATTMLAQLGSFLRARLESDVDQISLENELKTIRDYLAI